MPTLQDMQHALEEQHDRLVVRHRIANRRADVLGAAANHADLLATADHPEHEPADGCDRPLCARAERMLDAANQAHNIKDRLEIQRDQINEARKLLEEVTDSIEIRERARRNARVLRRERVQA